MFSYQSGSLMGRNILSKISFPYFFCNLSKKSPSIESTYAIQPDKDFKEQVGSFLY